MDNHRKLATDPTREVHVVLGLGEVGQSLFDLMIENANGEKIVGFDTKDGLTRTMDNFKNQFFNGGIIVKSLHICFGWSKDFKRLIIDYRKKLKYPFTVIHSTVPVGTTAQFGPGVVHSPVRGKHPDLKKSLATFVKFVGVNNEFDKQNAMTLLSMFGFKGRVVDGSNNTEAGKLLSTARYALNIAMAQETQRMCKKFGVKYGIVNDLFEKTYNEGYELMDMPHVKRPILTPGYIGGHCLMPNIKMLLKQFPSVMARAIKRSNDQWKKDNGK